MEEHYEFDEVNILSAFAMGVPGHRTFFLILGQKEKWVRAWVEKEQLQTLALAIDQFMSILSQDHPELTRRVKDASLSDDIPSTLPSAELEIDEIALGYDEERALLSFTVHAVGPQSEKHASLECRVTLGQLKHFASQAKKVCAGGRPRCALCGGPIDPEGHVCPRSN